MYRFVIAILFSLASFLLTEDARAFTISKTVYTNNLGLVGHWTFDGNDISGLVSSAGVDDRSGNDNSGTLQSMNLDKDLLPGKIGQAASFNGGNQYVAISDDTTLALGDVFSYSLWIKRGRTNHSTYEILISKGANSPVLLVDGTSSDANYIELWKHSGTRIAISTVTITDTDWHHVVATKNGSTVNLYIDGVNVTGTITNSTNASTAQPLHLATESGIPGNYFMGALDDVRIYNRAISAQEVKLLYNQGNSRLAVTSNDNKLTPGLVGHWTFDGKDMTTGSVIDKSGNGNSGSLLNMSTTTSRTEGIIGQAVRLDGVNDYVSVADAPSLDGFNDFGISFWMNSNTILGSGTSYLVSKYNITGDQRSWSVVLDWPASEIQINLSTSGTSFTGVAPFSDSSVLGKGWVHVVFTRSGNTVKAYVNGVQMASDTFSGTLFNSSSSLTVGANGAGTSPYGGQVDDVKIYNRSISEQEVKNLYNEGNSRMSTSIKRDNGLVGHWTFDGKDLLTGAIIDRSGNGNGGSLISMATSTSRAEGRIGQSLVFDGSDDYVRVPRSASLEASQGLTVTGWFKRDGAQLQYASIVSKTVGNGATTPYIQFGVEFNSNSDTDIQFCTGHTTNLHQCQATGNNTIPDNKWVFFAGVHDRVNNTISIYIGVDGAPLEVDSTSAQAADLKTDANRDLTIGAYLQSSVVRRFKGQIDDVRLYNRTFSAAEVQQIYETGK